MAKGTPNTVVGFYLVTAWPACQLMTVQSLEDFGASMVHQVLTPVVGTLEDTGLDVAEGAGWFDMTASAWEHHFAAPCSKLAATRRQQITPLKHFIQHFESKRAPNLRVL